MHNQDNFGHKPPVVTVSDIAKPGPRKISLLNPASAKRPKRFLKTALALIVLVILILGGFVFFRASSISSKIFVGQKTTFFQKLRDTFRGGSGSVKLIGEDMGQINVLLLGIGGEGHDGPYLTDTMILAQIRPDIGEVALISIPRDYLVTLPGKLGQGKINAAFAEGFARHKDWDEAGKWARTVVEQITGQTVPYFAVVDFKGFEAAIDRVGGIDIQVERTFTDYQYPDGKEGYLAPLTFTEGLRHFDGTKALQFARSRHAAGPEGSDFARSQRQQKVIEALKQKVTSMDVITDPRKLNDLLGIFADHFHTNISPGEILRIYNLVKDKGIDSFLSLSLDPSTNIICPGTIPIGEINAYIVSPCEGKTPQDVQNFFKNSFALGKMYEEKSVVWMADSTKSKTAYETADEKLKNAGLTVWEVPYTDKTFTQTVFYQVNPKPATAEFIKNTLGAAEVSLPPPGFKIDKNKVDVIVILGGTQ